MATPKPLNPYQVALGILAILLMVAGLIAILVSQPSDDFLSDDMGSAAGEAAGMMLLGAGATLGVAWLAVSALLWTPGPSRPQHTNPLIDRIEKL